ncbi:MAG: hypothetical protein M3O90_02420 [Actinomycetota bacterium]|nr:hypothetical protein [Actinomycetota bacterium]
MTRLPEPAADLRDHLPAIEPDRQVTDWGRSERVEGLLDRTLYDFLYHYWFRCEVEGIDNVPADGGVLLVSNHAGALPPASTTRRATACSCSRRSRASSARRSRRSCRRGAPVLSSSRCAGWG